MENKKATIEKTGIGEYNLQVEVNKTYTVSDISGELTIEEKLRDIASTLGQNSFRGYYCEAENYCDKQCKKCKDE